MPPLDLLISFLAATAIFAFTPGPGMFYMAVQTMAHGRRAGWNSSLAFHLASYLHIAGAAFGVTILLQTAPILLAGLKIAGGGYLIWMGIRMWLRSNPVKRPNRAVRGQALKGAFRDSLTVEILNPKSALFYFAFLPQFTSPEAALPVWAQILALGLVANVVFSLTDVVCIVFAHILAAKAGASANLAAYGRRIGGTILIAMGTRVITETR